MKDNHKICDGAGIGNNPIVSPRAAAFQFQDRAAEERFRLFCDNAAEVAMADGIDTDDGMSVCRYYLAAVRAWNEARERASAFFHVPQTLTFDKTLDQIELNLGCDKDEERLQSAITENNKLALAYLYRKATRRLDEATEEQERKTELAERKQKEAARSRKYSKAGKKGARVRNALRPKDTERDKIIEEAKRKIRECIDSGIKPKYNEIYRNVAFRHIGENGEPIVKPETIKQAIYRSKGEKRGHHNRNRH